MQRVGLQRMNDDGPEVRDASYMPYAAAVCLKSLSPFTRPGGWFSWVAKGRNRLSEWLEVWQLGATSSDKLSRCSRNNWAMKEKKAEEKMPLKTQNGYVEEIRRRLNHPCAFLTHVMLLSVFHVTAEHSPFPSKTSTLPRDEQPPLSPGDLRE